MDDPSADGSWPSSFQEWIDRCCDRWIGLVPRQHTTGGKPRLVGIGRQANHYLRRQMIHGARSIAFRMLGRDDARSKWLQALAARRGFNRAVVALANKTARIAWALLNRQEVYKAA